MQPRIYVAAPFSEWKFVREVQSEIRSRGGTITTDWTLEADKPGTDADLTEEIAVRAALADLQGVYDADAVLLLTVPDKALGNGMWVELGFALGARLAITGDNEEFSVALRNECFYRIAICGPQRDRNVFNRLARRFADWRDALPYVLGETP